MENRYPSVVFLISYPEIDLQSEPFAMKVTFFLIVGFLIVGPGGVVVSFVIQCADLM